MAPPTAAAPRFAKPGCRMRQIPTATATKPAVGQPRGVARRLATQSQQPVEGLLDIDPVGDEQVPDEPDVGGLVEPQPPVDRLEGGRITAGQTDMHAGRPGGDLHVGRAEVAAHLPQLVLDLVDRLAGGDHRRTEERQQPAAVAVAVRTTAHESVMAPPTSSASSRSSSTPARQRDNPRP